MTLYAQTSGTLTTNSGSLVAIPGLSLTIPEGVDDSVIVIVNLPNPYAEGNNYPGAVIGLAVNGTVSPVQAAFTSGDQTPQSAGRVPTTLVVAVPLIDSEQTVTAMWCGVRGSTVIIDSPATLTVLDD